MVYADGILPPTAAVVPARPVVVVNLSEVGMLLESAWYIRPSRLVEVRLTFSDCTVTVVAEILRAYVSTLDRHKGLRYRAALSFATRISVPDDRDLLEGCRRGLAGTR